MLKGTAQIAAGFKPTILSYVTCHLEAQWLESPNDVIDLKIPHSIDEDFLDLQDVLFCLCFVLENPSPRRGKLIRTDEAVLRQAG